ncbi:MAG: right-handed parallel beta-helix repeat-containing protein [Planctomycetota bacterium]
MRLVLRSTLIPLAFFFFGHLSAAFATDIFVSRSSGDDTASIDQASRADPPFASLPRAIESADGDDSIIILDGTFINLDLTIRPPEIPQTNAREEAIWTGRSLRIAAIDRDDAAILGRINVIGCRNITIENLAIRPSATKISFGGLSFSGCNNVTVRSCRVNLQVVSNSNFTFTNCDNVLIEWNILEGSSNDPTSFIFPRPRVGGIEIDSPTYLGPPERDFGIWIRNNTIFGRNFGIEYRQDDATSPSRYDRPCMLENNLIFDTVDVAIDVLDSRNIRLRHNSMLEGFQTDAFELLSIQGCDRVYAYNNLISRSRFAAPARFVNNFESLLFSNLLDGGGGFDAGLQLEIAMMNRIQPANIIPGDFKPRSDSPAIDTAFNPGDLFLFDVRGAQRIQGRAPDMGAIEQ